MGNPWRIHSATHKTLPTVTAALVGGGGEEERRGEESEGEEGLFWKSLNWFLFKRLLYILVHDAID